MAARPHASGLVLLAAIGCAGCHHAATDNAAKIKGGDPTEVATVCSSAETLDNLKSIVFDQINLGDATPPINPAYKSQLAAGAKVTLEVPTLDSFDKVTRKVTCSAKVTFTWPTDLVGRLQKADSTVAWGADTTSGTFSIQPAADKSGLVYALDGPIYNTTVGSVVAMLHTLAKADADAQAAALAAKTPPHEPAPSGEPSLSPDDVSAAGDTRTTTHTEQ